jgi:hypothetical protein
MGSWDVFDTAARLGAGPSSIHGSISGKDQIFLSYAKRPRPFMGSIKVLFSEYQGQCGRDIKITYINLVLKLRKVEVQLHSLTCLHGRRVKGQHYPYTTKHIQFTQLKFHTPPTWGVQPVSPETQFHKYTNLEITASRPRKPRIPKSI